MAPVQVESIEDFETIEMMARAKAFHLDFDLMEAVDICLGSGIRPSKVGQVWKAVLERADWIVGGHDALADARWTRDAFHFLKTAVQ